MKTNNETQTLIVNFYGGPGTGKSTICASVFSKLKWAKVNCEMALEYAKDIVWEESFKKLENQIYIFAKQHNRINRLQNKVDVILTDSPILFSLVYGPNDEFFRNMIVDEYKKMNNLDIFLDRVKGYNPKGRTQNLEEAKLLDVKIKDVLEKHSPNYQNFIGEQESEEKITKHILEILSNKK